MKRIIMWQKIGFVFVGISGVLLHFIYDWTNKSIIVAPFSAVNESTWEHMKLLFFPLFAFTLIEYRFIGKERKDFMCIKLAGTLAGLAAIPLLYYTYTSALGTSADWFNITIFFIAAAVTFLLETHLMKHQPRHCISPTFAFVVMCAIALSFFVLTFVQPKLPLFLDPVTNAYGI